MRSQVLKLDSIQYCVMCGTLPKHAVCGFQQIKETRLVKTLQLCLLQFKIGKSHRVCPQFSSLTDLYMLTRHTHVNKINKNYRGK